MKAAFFIQFLLLLLVTGCTPFILTRQIAPALDAANLDFQVKDFSVRSNKGFLEVEVRASQKDSDYRSNFDLELANAAEICGALAKSDAVFKYSDWQEMELTFWNEYGNVFRWRNTVAFLKVNMSRETLRMLHEENIPVSDYPNYWHIQAGSKAGPDSEMLEWRPGESGPRSNTSTEQIR